MKVSTYIPVENFGTVVGENPDCLLLSGTVVGENPDCLLLSGTVVGENPDHVCWDYGFYPGWLWHQMA